MNHHDRELVATVRSDLEYLRERVSGDISPDDLRRLSVILRRLFTHEQDFLKAWRLLVMEPKQPVIRAVRLHDPLKGYDQNGNLITSDRWQDAVTVAMPPRRGGSTMSFREGTGGGPPSAPLPRTQEDMPLSDYLDSCGFVVFGTKIKRRQIITFIAHKKGGAHLDRNRRKDEQVYSLLDQVHDPQPRQIGEYSADARLMIGDMTQPYKYFETIAIEVADAADVQRFVVEAASYKL